SDHQRTDIKCATGPIGNPFSIQVHQFLKYLNKKIFREFRHTHSAGRSIEPVSMFPGTKKKGHTMLILCRFHPFKDGLSIVQSLVGRMEGEILYRGNFHIAPASISESGFKQMSRKYLSKRYIIKIYSIDFGLRNRRNLYI